MSKSHEFDAQFVHLPCGECRSIGRTESFGSPHFEEAEQVTERKFDAVNKLFQDSLSARVSRRDVLKRGAALGLAASSIAALSRAYGVSAQDATPSPVAAGSTLTAPTNLRTDLAGQKITVTLGADGPTVPWEQAACDLFASTTGIEVKRLAGPQSATDRLSQYQQLLGASASDVDAMMIDVIWPGILGAYAVDLSAAMTSEPYQYFDRIVKNNTVNGILVGIPWYTDAGLLYYRQDLLEKYSIAGPPATWADLETAAKTIQDGERASNPDFQGFVFQGSAYEGLTCDALEWQVSNGGGTIIDETGKVTVNNPQAIAAFNRAKGWIGTISPPGVTDFKEEESRGVWQGGNAAFMRNWPYAYSLGEAADSVIKGTFDVTLVPKGDGEGATNADTLGGWQMMVSKFSKSPDAATEFAKYLTSLEVQKSYAIEQSRLPTIPDLYDDPAVLAVNPFFGSLKDVFLGGAVARPSTVTSDLYNEVSTDYFTAINQILVGNVETEAAIADLEGKLNDIVAEL
jgi:trehalose/maltose transport system substrate-binding protein